MRHRFSRVEHPTAAHVEERLLGPSLALRYRLDDAALPSCSAVEL